MSIHSTQLHAAAPAKAGGSCTAAEEAALAQFRAAIQQKLALGYRTPQFQLLQSTVDMVTAATGEAWEALVDSAVSAICTAHKVTSVTPYIFHNVSESSRILPSDYRADLKKMLQRRGLLRLPRCETEATKLAIQRCAIAAAISAEKGAIHIARQNIGAVLQQIHNCDGLRELVNWTEERQAALCRTHGNIYRAP